VKYDVGNNQSGLIKTEKHGLTVRSLSGGLIGRGLAELRNLPAALPKNWTNDLGIEFIRIDPGIFLMGSPDTDETARDDERPQHRVRISQPFYLGKYPVTQSQWRAVMSDDPFGFFRGDNYPVEGVSWDDTQAFIRELTAKNPGKNYRLPTEAEWEYACRAGTTTRYFFGDESGRVFDFAWGLANSGDQSQPVGRKEPNPWGLYDMLGNVNEWVADWSDEEYYQTCMDSEEYEQSGLVTDPTGPDSDRGIPHVLRGGCYSSWYNSSYHPFTSSVRSACRIGIGIDVDTFWACGFRLAFR